MNKLLDFGNGHIATVFQKDTASAAVCAVNCMAPATDPCRISRPAGTARSAYAAPPPAYGNSAVPPPLFCSAGTIGPLALFASLRLTSLLVKSRNRRFLACRLFSRQGGVHIAKVAGGFCMPYARRLTLHRFLTHSRSGQNEHCILPCLYIPSQRSCLAAADCIPGSSG